MADIEAMVAWVARELAARANPDKAAPMAAYMKTDMPFYGVQKPGRTEVLAGLRERFPLTSPDELEDAVRALWRQPHREERYLALALARAERRLIRSERLGLCRDLIVDGAWWDLVDEVAVHLVGDLWLHDRARVGPVMDEWVDDPDMWLRRTALIGQTRHRDETDQARLFRYCSRRAGEREFFIRKAIGWALREYSKTAPEAVRDYLLANGSRLSPLSRREGARRLLREGLMDPGP